MFGFFRKKDIPQLEPPVKAKTGPSLADDFKTAVYGDFCRTTAFRPRQDTEENAPAEYLKAMATLSPDRWRVVRVQESWGAATPEGKPFKTKILADDVVFFEAVRQLSLYESTQDPAVFDSAGPSKEELGFSHYELFAKREGIAFETDGTPHPTRRGEILTEGVFTDSMEKQVADFAAKKLADGFGHVSSTAFAARIFGAHRIGTDLGKISSRADAQRDMANICIHIKALLAYISLWPENGTREMDMNQVTSMASFRGYTLNIKDTSYTRRWHDHRKPNDPFMDISESTLNTLKGAEFLGTEQIKTSRDIIHQMVLFQKFREAKAAVRRYRETDPLAINITGVVECALDAAWEAGRSAGYAYDALQAMRDSALSSAPSPEIPPHFEDFITSMEALYEKTAEAVALEWKKTDPPQLPRPAAPGRRPGGARVAPD